MPRNPRWADGPRALESVRFVERLEKVPSVPCPDDCDCGGFDLSYVVGGIEVDVLPDGGDSSFDA